MANLFELTEGQQKTADRVWEENRDHNDQYGLVIKRFYDVNRRVGEGWEPVAYDEYIDGNWTYKVIDVEGLEPFQFYRHVATGKMYKKNQRSRIWNWTFDHREQAA